MRKGRDSNPRCPEASVFEADAIAAMRPFLLFSRDNFNSKPSEKQKTAHAGSFLLSLLVNKYY